MTTTQSELARQLGLSQATVSLVLRGGGKASPQTRQRILEQAARMGYRHNSSAQALRNGRYGCISLLMSTTVQHSFLPTGLLRGIQTEVSRQETQLRVIEAPDTDLLNERFVHQMLRRWSSDGLLIDYTHNLPERMVELIRSYRLPSVWLNAKLDADSVCPDDFDAALRATRHLIDLGHRKIGYVDLTRSAHYSVRDRYDGYAEAMYTTGLTPHPFTRPIPRHERLDVLHRWLAGPDRPTAVLTYEDQEAISLFAAAMRLGLRVPEDLSIIAVHDNPVDAVGMTLSTMQSDFIQVGTQAVRMLMKKIHDPVQEVASEKVRSRWLAGDSCSPPGCPCS